MFSDNIMMPEHKLIELQGRQVGNPPYDANGNNQTNTPGTYWCRGLPA